MIKLITPPGMLLTVALLVIYSAYAFLIGSIEKSWVLLAGGGVAIVASYGTAMLRPWSRYLVYALAIGFVAKLAQSMTAAIRAGYFGFQFDRRSRRSGRCCPACCSSCCHACAACSSSGTSVPGPRRRRNQPG